MKINSHAKTEIPRAWNEIRHHRNKRVIFAYNNHYATRNNVAQNMNCEISTLQ